MHRKFKISFHYNHNLQPRRTTIHLPNSIDIKFPTKEINERLLRLDNLIKSYKNSIFYEKHLSSVLEKDGTKTNSYQIILEANNISKLSFLKEVTGLNFSRLAGICFT